MKRFIFLSCLIMGLTSVSKIQSATIFDDWRKGVGFCVGSSVVATGLSCFLNYGIQDGKFESKEFYKEAPFGAVMSIFPIATYFLVRNKNISSSAKRTLIAIASPIIFSLVSGITGDEKIKDALTFGVPAAVVSGGMMYAGTRFGAL